MAWNYRLMKHKESEQEYITIHEVYYNPGGKIISWSKEPINPYSEDINGLRWVLNKMKAAFHKPVLDYDMEPEANTNQ